MSFEGLKVPELRAVAQEFGIDESTAKTKTELITLLEGEGVTYDAWQTFVAAASNTEAAPKEELPSPAARRADRDPDLVLVKMDRANPYFEITVNGTKYGFDERHPFVAMPEDDADAIFDTEDGFRLATGGEAKSYYA